MSKMTIPLPSSQDIAEIGAGKFVTGELPTLGGGGQSWGETWTTAKPDSFKEQGALSRAGIP